ncbi:uncharacterized protein SCHCODRAFT_02673454 [Schizophyllum commune H4-8]|nr:uncharacterized protein SCHCODRAFT_02673454 [Schizophyllum commune H4-8]KAI5885746.1 hypothetical protein SCHCODRAFT_02673454 [Schizophyllum commune H4-8]
MMLFGKGGGSPSRTSGSRARSEKIGCAAAHPLLLVHHHHYCAPCGQRAPQSPLSSIFTLPTSFSGFPDALISPYRAQQRLRADSEQEGIAGLSTPALLPTPPGLSSAAHPPIPIPLPPTTPVFVVPRM